jgi:hypothetical protein
MLQIYNNSINPIDFIFYFNNRLSMILVSNFLHRT